MNQSVKKVIKHWEHIAPLVKCPKNAREYDLLVSRLDELLEIVGHDMKHPLMSLIDIMGNVISAYDEKHYHIAMGKGIDALRFLMEEHQLCQSDFTELGSQGVMSEILNGKRALNVRQIRLLAKRFHVDPSTFLDDE